RWDKILPTRRHFPQSPASRATQIDLRRRRGILRWSNTMSDQAIPGKRPSESAVTLSHLMNPVDANAAGNVHGGVILRLVDEAGALAAIRHSRRNCVTVRLDSMTFIE